MRLFLISLLACKAPTEPPLPDDRATPSEVPGSPTTFGSFYEQLQDKICPMELGECESAFEALDCAVRNDTPACVDFNPATAALCLEGTFACLEGQLLGSSACEEICADTSFSPVGRPAITPNCEQMLLCDEALAQGTPDFTRIFVGGLADEAYGIGGSCYEGDADACDAACASAVEGLRTAGEAYVSAGTLDAVPEACL